MHCSLIAQLVEHSTVNRVVAGSSPARGAIMESCPSGRRSTIGNRVGVTSASRVRIPRSPPLRYGPLVKWLRHLPFTEVTGVRVPYGSPRILWALSSAGRASALQAEGRRFDPVSAHHMYFLELVVHTTQSANAVVAQLVEQLTCNQ